MKYNKGFASIVILLIVLGIFAIGGVVYYAGNNNSKPVDNNPTYPPITRNENPPKQPTINLPSCNSSSPASIKVLSPNGGQLWKIGQTYAVNWSTCNAPANSWVRFSYSIPSGVGTIHYTRDCFGGEQIPASQGNYTWAISSSVFGCSDAGEGFPPDISFQTKVKAELYTGAPICNGGLPIPGAPCGTGTLHAQDESDNNFTLSNLP